MPSRARRQSRRHPFLSHAFAVLPPPYKTTSRAEEEASHPSSPVRQEPLLQPDHGNRFHPDALPLPRPACPHRQVPLPQSLPILLRRRGLAARPPAPPHQVRPRCLHEIRRPAPPLPRPAHPRDLRRAQGRPSQRQVARGPPRRRRRRQERRRRPGRQGRRKRREQRHGRVLPPRATRGPGEPAAAAQLRHVPARGGARPGGRRGLLRARAAGLTRRRRPAQPLRPRHLGGAPGEGPRRGVLRARRAGSARRLLRARIVRELPVGRRGRGGGGGSGGTGRSAERLICAWVPGTGVRVLSCADRSTRRTVIACSVPLMVCNCVQYIGRGKIAGPIGRRR